MTHMMAMLSKGSTEVCQQPLEKGNLVGENGPHMA